MDRPQGEGEAGGEADPGGGQDAPVAAHPSTPPTLRRLSHGEYANTVRDLFAPLVTPAQVFTRDAVDHGYENQASVMAPSPLLVEQRRSAAAQIAEATASRLDLGCPAERDGACVLQWFPRFLERAFRAPLTDDDRQVYGALVQEALETGGPDLGVRILIEAALQSPRFLYRIDDGSAYAAASRLSYFLWGSMPDASLLAAAASGTLAEGSFLRDHARRLLADPRARAQVLEFHRQWLGLDVIRGVHRSPALYPNYHDALKASMRQEADRFIEARLFPQGSHADLLGGAASFVDERLAGLYGVEAPADEQTWSPVDHHPSERAGLLTQGWFLASQGHLKHPSPILRGVFVLERVLCRRPASPGPAVDQTPPSGDEPNAPVTNRERYAALTDKPACRGCHEDIDGIGFSFESYDGIGAFRLEDGGQPVDSSGWLTLDGERVEVSGAVELAHRLADSADVDRCIARQWFRFAFGRDLAPDEAPWLQELTDRWREDGRDTLELVKEIAVALAVAR